MKYTNTFHPNKVNASVFSNTQNLKVYVLICVKVSDTVKDKNWNKIEIQRDRKYEDEMTKYQKTKKYILKLLAKYITIYITVKYPKTNLSNSHDWFPASQGK